MEDEGKTDVGDCIACGKGKYSDIDGLDHAGCVICAVGKYQDQEGQISEVDCTACKGGKYSLHADLDNDGQHDGHDGEEDCVPCAKGKYSSIIAADSDDVCIPCAAGKYVWHHEGDGSEEGTHFAHDSEDDCQSCVAGKFLPDVGSFTSSLLQPPCFDCEAGKYSTVVGADSDTCTLCFGGEYQNLEGQSSCNLCPKNNTMTHDKLNRTSVDNCLACPDGTYRNAENPFGCSACNKEYKIEINNTLELFKANSRKDVKYFEDGVKQEGGMTMPIEAKGGAFLEVIKKTHYYPEGVSPIEGNSDPSEWTGCLAGCPGGQIVGTGRCAEGVTCCVQSPDGGPA